MQYILLLALVSVAAVVNADEIPDGKYHSETYKESILAPEHYNCDATSHKCYEPTSYGKGYDAATYTYHKKFPYPGPGHRFCTWAKSLKVSIGHFFGIAIGKFRRSWKHFKAHWETWCGEIKSDLARFAYWKECKAKEWKLWWEYYHDLHKTKKAYWDNAQREFHRQWCNYREHRRDEYEATKKRCRLNKEKEYDETPEYEQQINNYGVTPVEDYHKSYSSGGKSGTGTKYNPETYQDSCKAEALTKEDKSPTTDKDYLGSK